MADTDRPGHRWLVEPGRSAETPALRKAAGVG